MGPDPAGSHSRFRAAMELRLQKDVPALSARLPCSADRVFRLKTGGHQSCREGTGTGGCEVFGVGRSGVVSADQVDGCKLDASLSVVMIFRNHSSASLVSTSKKIKLPENMLFIVCPADVKFSSI